MSAPNPQREAVEVTPRTCRYCRQRYVAPKGERWAGCSRCCPTFYDAIEQGEPDAPPPSGTRAPDRGPRVGLALLDAETGRTYPLPYNTIPF